MKKRVISGEIIYDDKFNSLSLEAQNLFVRMLAVSDDFGIVPSNLNALKSLTNFQYDLQRSYDELINNNLGKSFIYNNNKYFAFNKLNFDKIQSWFLNKRTKSEYLYLKSEDLLMIPEVSRNFQNIPEIPADSGRDKYKEVSSKQKAESIKLNVDNFVDNFNLEDIKCYFSENSYSDFDSINFFNYNTARGWKVGGKRVENWQNLANLYFTKIKKVKIKMKCKKCNQELIGTLCYHCEIDYTKYLKEHEDEQKRKN